MNNKYLDKYKSVMKRLLLSYDSNMTEADAKNIVDYSVKKRFTDFDAYLRNNYIKKNIDLSGAEILEYITKKETILTSYGVLFKTHANSQNPMISVIQNFAKLRKMHKKEMFKYPKGSEQFERYNLLQQLDKIDMNGIYGLIGLAVSFLFDLNVAPSVTSMGRSLISSAIMCFEMFLGNNVKFGSLDDVLVFIDNVRKEYKEWKFDDEVVLGKTGFVDVYEVFNKLILNCGYKYVPTTEDMDIVLKILQSCTQTELNRLYYKNNLYGIMDTWYARNLMFKIFENMDFPYMDPAYPPVGIRPYLDELKALLLEYVFYCYQIYDRMDRNKNMIKKISLISDTDSSFVSLDAWYNYNIKYLEGHDFKILHQSVDVAKLVEKCEKSGEEIPEYLQNIQDSRFPISFFERDDWGDPINSGISDCITFEEPEYDYDFFNQEKIEINKLINPIETIPQENMKFSLVNIMCYILTDVINRYMIDFTKESGSYRADTECAIVMKNEFFMTRVLLENVKKHYASLQQLQEGNYLGGVPDVKGIDCLVKSVIPKTTRDRLNKILLKDILLADNIDRTNIIKQMAILENEIYSNIMNGSKNYYKPATIKSLDSYENPLRVFGVKGLLLWNYVKDEHLAAIDVKERNSVDIIKIAVNAVTVEKLKDEFPYQYERFLELLGIKECNNDEVKLLKSKEFQSIALPLDVPVPRWIELIVDYRSIIVDNLGGFPLNGVGISQLDSKKVPYTNIIKL
jgi:hypothetical protein|nr:MAG TPA: DNA polymerase [Caudoviricetes sp.]